MQLPDIYGNTPVIVLPAQSVATFPVNTFLENLAILPSGDIYLLAKVCTTPADSSFFDHHIDDLHGDAKANKAIGGMVVSQKLSTVMTLRRNYNG
jgi:hypothetical protein